MTAKFPILLIDDDPAIGEVLQRALLNIFPEAGLHQVFSAQQATDYLDQLAGPRLQLLLLDLDLNGSNGLDILTKLRAHPRGRLFPVVVLSANDDPDQVRQAYAAGAASFTQKPFSFQQWKDCTAALRCIGTRR